jgi:hypothetical protein
MKCVFICLFVALVLAFVNAQIPCDEAYGTHCPEASGLEVGECLKKLDSSSLSKECSDYIQLHDNCRDDLEKHCTGKEYTGDALGKLLFCSSSIVTIIHVFASLSV